MQPLREDLERESLHSLHYRSARPLEAVLNNLRARLGDPTIRPQWEMFVKLRCLKIDNVLRHQSNNNDTNTVKIASLTLLQSMLALGVP